MKRKVIFVESLPIGLGIGLLLAMGAILVWCSPTLSQTFYGSIVGNVTDASAGVIPGASVTLTNLGTSERRSMETDSIGFYQFVNLVPGRYRVEAEKSGFKRFAREPVVVEVQSAVRIDVSMELGEVSQVVEVTAQTPLLQSETSSLGQVVEQRKVTEMPLNGRNVLNLVSLAPGVVPQGQSMRNPTGTNPFAWGNYQIGGGQANQSATTIDGAPVNVSYVNLTALVPTQDSIQEFKVQTNNLGPEFGRFAGGVINLTTKSGTNAFHGSAYDFLRNKVLNANTFFNNASGISRPPFTQNQFGGNVGGPIFRDKTFFFTSYEGYRERQGQSFLLTVPTLAMRQGDFSNLRDRNGNLIPIYDPLTTCGRLGNPSCALDANGREIITRQQFPGNIIPPNRLDPTAKVLANLWAPPNLPGQPFTHINNYATNASIGGNNDQFTVRIDQNVSEKQRIFGRYTYWTNLNLPIDPYRTKTYVDRGREDFNVNQFVLADTYTFTPTTIGDFRVSFFRFHYDRTPESLGVDLTTFGWPASLNNQVAFRHIPTPCVEGFRDVFCSQGTGSVIVARNDNYAFSPSLTKIAGRHALKFGGEVRRDTHNYAQSNVASGIFNFNENFTASNPFSPTGGFGFASFILGFGTGGNATTPLLVAGQQIYRSVYVSDILQLTNKLTLNLGLRYEQAGAWSERFDRLTVLLPQAENPLAGPTGLVLRGRLGLVASPERESRNPLDLQKKNFAPRVGLAYRLTNKTVLRTGYGIFWLPNNLTWNISPNNHIVNTLATPFVNSIDGGITPLDRLSNPFPNGILQPPGRDPRFQSILLGQSIRGPIPTEPLGYAQQWNFNIQQELPDGTLIDVAYGGSKGTHLPASSQEIDQLPDRFLSLGPALQEQVPNPFFDLISTGPLSARTVSRGQLLRPFPQYNGVQISGPGNRSSTYHSAQLKVEKRFGGGGSILASYTIAKLISDTDTLTAWLEPAGAPVGGNNNNLRLERSLAGFDVPQRLVVSYVLDLPVGKGKRLLSDVSGVADRLVSGWGINGATTFQKGFPIALRTAQNLTNSFGGGSRPNNNGQSARLTGSAQSRLNQWFDTSVFRQPPAFTFGNVARTLPEVRTHGINNFDFALFKNTYLKENVGIQFRAEFFNLFNRVQFDYPGQILGTSQFGIVSSQLNNPRLTQFALRFIF